MEATREAFRLLVRWTTLTVGLLVALMLGFYLFLRPLATLSNAARMQRPVIQLSPSSPQEIEP